LPKATGKDGSFAVPVDMTVLHRYVATVTDASRASVSKRNLTAAQREALVGANGGFSVGYAIDKLTAKVQKNGNVLVSGRVHDTQSIPPPPVSLYTYQLNGTVTDASGSPVQGAVVVTRTQDRDFWTFSSPTDGQGHFTSFFKAADETGADPVSIAVGVASGATSYGGNLGINVNFPRLKSATVNIKLGSGTSLTASDPSAYAGAIYQGIVVGVTGPNGVIKPVSERWPDKSGNFSMVLPASTRGKTIRFWENDRVFFSPSAQVPGGPVDLRSWPKALSPAVPSGLASLAVPKG
jgi:hypothetical protein